MALDSEAPKLGSDVRGRKLRLYEHEEEGSSVVLAFVDVKGRSEVRGRNLTNPCVSPRGTARVYVIVTERYEDRRCWCKGYLLDESERVSVLGSIRWQSRLS